MMLTNTDSSRNAITGTIYQTVYEGLSEVEDCMHLFIS